MKRKEIKFSLVYRDMWQSSGKYVPRVDQLLKIAPHIVEMGCFARVETNGGGFEQINLLFGENPNKSVRDWTKPFKEAGIQTHMLERALNGIRMSPVPTDVRKLMFEVKKKQGTDIARSFCGLNDARNILDSVKYAKAGGMIAQATLSLTYSKVHTVESYVNLADELIKGGADEICLKDMAGIARPYWLGQIVTGIRALHPDIPLQYHSHSGPGFAMASILEVCRAGVDYIDVAMEPLSWGTGHVDLLAVHAMLSDDGFEVPAINMDAYMKVRSLTQEFIDDFLGYYIDPKNRYMNSMLIGPGLPGGMMGSLMADLENNLSSLNKWMAKRNKPQLTQDELLIRLFNEVEYIWPMLGYPPLVTPYSQYVKNLALMNVMQVAKGESRWSMIADNIWDMLLGKGGKLPGKLDDTIIKLAQEAGKEFFTGCPQDLFPDALDTFRKEMNEKGWALGQDDEELLELAMHPAEYRAYKSGAAKKSFEEDLAKRKVEGGGLNAGSGVGKKVEEKIKPSEFKPSVMFIDVEGERFRVSVDYGENNYSSEAQTAMTYSTSAAASQSLKVPSASEPVNHSPQHANHTPKASAPIPQTSAPIQENPSNDEVKTINAPLEGKFFLTKESSQTGIKVGDSVREGDIIGYIEAMKTYNAIHSDVGGVVVEICSVSGNDIEEDDVILKIK